jgi:kumamolisin
MTDGHVALAGSERARKHDAQRVDDVKPEARIEVTLTLGGLEPPPLDTSKPGISRSELERGFGASDADIAKVCETLVRYGLEVEDSSALARSVRVSGTAAQMEAAFHARLGIYRSERDGEFRGREGALEIPADLEGVVTGVFGLDQRRVARRGRSATSASSSVAQVVGLGPSELEERYAFPASSAAGQTVAIAEFGGAYFPSDLSKFCEQHGLSVPQVTVVNAGEQPPTPAEVQELPQEQREEIEDISGEVMMDIEIVAGLCQGAEILVLFSTWDEKGWIDLLNAVIEGKSGDSLVLSISWGAAEDSPDWSKAALKEIDRRLQAAARLGITVCAASGDDGSGDQLEDGRAHINFPSTSPFVLSVGGTMIEGKEEVVWWEEPGTRKGHGGATGGGVSVIFQRPSWQTVQVQSLNHGSIDGRVVPDIAALAGPPFYDLVILGQRGGNGGTSAATPLWASLITRMAAAGKPTQKPVFMAPLLYANAPQQTQPVGELGCTDIVKGDNRSEPEPGQGYQATPGFDAVSGWGIPNGQRLIAALP